MKLVALFIVMLTVIKADPRPYPPTGSANKIVSVPSGNAYNVPAGASQPLPEKAPGHNNPKVTIPSNGIEAGKPVEIKWGEVGNYGYVNIDVVNSCGLMNQPLNIATVPAAQHSYTWQVPKYLKDGDCYSVRVWGYEQPRRGEDAGTTGNIKIHNNDANANSRFIVNNVDNVEVGKPCKVTWDYSPVSSHPAMVDIHLCSSDENGERVHHIATVPCDQKEYTWTPTKEHLEGSKHHFQVAGGPITENCDYGANGETFVVGNVTEVEVREEQVIVEPAREEVVQVVVVESGAVVAKGVGMMAVAAIVVPLAMLL